MATKMLLVVTNLSFNYKWLARHLGANSFLPNGWILRLLAYECELMKYAKEICENIIFVLCGFDEEEFNTAS